MARKKRTCVICGFDVPKGLQYFTVKTSKSTTRIVFSMCDDCGRKAQETLANAFLAFITMAREELAKALERKIAIQAAIDAGKENAKND